MSFLQLISSRWFSSTHRSRCSSALNTMGTTLLRYVDPNCLMSWWNCSPTFSAMLYTSVSRSSGSASSVGVGVFEAIDLYNTPGRAWHLKQRHVCLCNFIASCSCTAWEYTPIFIIDPWPWQTMWWELGYNIHSLLVLWYTCMKYCPMEFLDDSLDFKESLEVVDLPKCHGNEQERLKHRPPHHSWVSVVIDWRARRMCN